MGRIEEIREQLVLAERFGSKYGITNTDTRELLSRLQIAEKFCEKLVEQSVAWEDEARQILDQIRRD